MIFYKFVIFNGNFIFIINIIVGVVEILRNIDNIDF